MRRFLREEVLGFAAWLPSTRAEHVRETNPKEKPRSIRIRAVKTPPSCQRVDDPLKSIVSTLVPVSILHFVYACVPPFLHSFFFFRHKTHVLPCIYFFFPAWWGWLFLFSFFFSSPRFFIKVSAVWRRTRFTAQIMGSILKRLCPRKNLTTCSAYVRRRCRTKTCCSEACQLSLAIVFFFLFFF